MRLFKFHRVSWNTKQCLAQTAADVDKNQEDSTKRLRCREQKLHRWKCELERAINAMTEEITTLAHERRRLKQAMAVLMIPESIGEISRVLLIS